MDSWPSPGVVPALLGSCLALTLLFTACSNATSTTSDEPAGAGSTSAPELLENERQVEQLVTSCMRDRGFEYQIDVDAVAQRVASVAGNDLSQADYAATYGFGVTTSQGEAVEEAVDETSQQSPADSGPNDRYYDELDDAGKQAWDEALYGQNTAEGGCYDQAIAFVYEADPGVIGGVEEASGEALERATSDPEMVALMQQWSGCMADSGFGYGLPIDMYLDLSDQLATVSGAAESSADELEELQEYERTLATAHLECITPLDAEYRKILDRHSG